MADVVNRGSEPNDPGADTLYDAFGKVNTKFDSVDGHDHSGVYLEEETDPVVGAVDGIVEADGAGNIGAAATREIFEKEFDGLVIVDPPATETSAGVKRQAAIDDDYLYICYDTDSWGRIALDKSWT